jgi:tetratricopeptide (TPR) repeat protein
LAERRAELPLHLRHLRDTHFWFEHLPESGALYVQFNSVNNSPEETLEQFTNRLWAFYEDNPGQIDKFVLDLRYNPGGNGYLLRPFIHEFIKHEEISKRGNLYAIIGPGTFSAASNCLAQLIEHTEVIVVGEPASGPLNWCSDTQLLQLPHSSMSLRVSTLCWQGGHASDARGYFPPEHPVPSLASDLFAGTDRALEVILEGKVSPLVDILRNDGAQEFMTEYERRSAEFSDMDWWYPYLPFDLALLGFEMLRSDRPEDAIAAFRLNTTHYPDNWRTWDDLGDAYRANNQVEPAIESYVKSWELNPDNPYVQGHLETLRFLSAYNHGGIDEANRLLRRARNENPRAYSEDAINRIGYSVLSDGKKREAIDIFMINTQDYPESWNAWDSLAEAYMENGDIEQAIKNYEKSLELNPANDNAREMLRRIRSRK